MDRATASINLTPKFFDDLLSVNFNVKGAYITNRYQKGVLGGAVSFNPTLPVFMPGGNNLNNYTSYGNGGSLISGDNGVKINTLEALNPVAELMDYSSKSKVYQSIGNLQLDLKMPFLRELRANLNLGYDYSHGECTNFNMPFSPSAWKDGHYVPGSDVSVRDGYTTKYKENEERYNLLLDFPTAALGGDVEIPTIEGTRLKVKIDNGTQPGKTLRLRGKGLPAVQGYGHGMGDLIVNISVYVPKTLSREEKDALTQFKDSDNFKGDSSTKRSIFERFKNYFN